MHTVVVQLRSMWRLDSRRLPRSLRPARDSGHFSGMDRWNGRCQLGFMAEALHRIPDPLALAHCLHEWVERHQRRGLPLDWRDAACARVLADDALDLDALASNDGPPATRAFWKVMWLGLRQKAARFLRTPPSRRKRLAMLLLERAYSHPVALPNHAQLLDIDARETPLLDEVAFV